jgi:uncharacterized repeat protein (TIGR01451 family)
MAGRPSPRRHRLSAACLLALLALAARPATAATSVGAATARLVADRGHVAVLELDGNYDQTLPNGEGNFDPREAVAQEFFKSHPDEYDFLIVWSTFGFDTKEASAFCMPVANDVQGIGLPLFDNTDLFGSQHKLQAYVDMASLAGWATDPLAPGFEKTLVVLSHEMLHRWGAYVHFKPAGGSPSGALLGQDGNHWSYLLDTDASVLYGADWRENGDGSFTSGAVLKFWSPLDLYLAGFYAPEQVPPFFLIDNPAVDATQLSRSGATVTGTKRVVTIADVIAAEGPRVPPAATSQKQLRAAFVLVTRPGEAVTDAQILGVERVREALGVRFSALTGGLGLLETVPQALPGSPGSPTGIPGGGTPRTTPVDLSQALAWLRGRQTAQGYWEDTPGTRLRDTAVALATLSSLDPQFTGKTPALAWLRSQTGANTDFAARLAAVSQQVGGDGASARAALVALQGADGGWGAGAGYGSDAVDTALAVLALTAAPPSATESAAVSRASAFLAAAQNADGGWSGVPGGPSRTTAATTVLRALRAAGADAGPGPRAIAWLRGRQSAADGGFGDSPSTVHDTANALDALITAQSLGQIDAAAASTFLSARQTVEGSWDGSVYATALAVSALKRFGSPNWRLAAPPSVSPQSPRDGQRVRIDLAVANDGSLAAPAGVLRLFDGDPAQGGSVAAADAVVPALAAGGAVTVTVYWDSFGKAGPHTLFAVLDPDGAVAELSENDNRASVAVDVQAAPALADLEVQAPDLSISPERPTVLPADLAISVAVRNLGQADAGSVAVELRQGLPATGTPVERKVVMVPGRSSAAANFVYPLAAPGSTTLSVVVDPDDAVAEDREDNNAASRTVSTGPSLDLAVADADLSIAGSPYPGGDVTFKAVLHNRGTVDAPAAAVRFQVTDGSVIRELGRTTVQLPAGQSAERTVAWRVDLQGALRLVVAVDPDGLVPEADETDNSASLSFTAGALDVPNLALGHDGLTFDPHPGREGHPLTLTARVRNNGGQAAADVEVGFYEGDPAQGGPLLGALQTIPSIPAGGEGTATVVWPRVPDAGDRVIYGIADPGHRIAEASEDDNGAFEVLPVLSLPDPAVTAASLELDPRFPAPGQAVSLRVTVANLGEQEAQGLMVRLYDGDPAAGGTPVGPDQAIDLPGSGSATAVFSWTFGGGGGSRPLVAVVDPDNSLEEGSEADNTARIDVAVQSGDLYVTERHLSPNGDGVQETTQLFFRLGSPAAAVEVVDAHRGTVVRRGALGGVTAGQWVWDGKDDLGRVVRDADYTLRLVDGSGAVLGSTAVAVDTDRLSLLEAAGTPFGSATNLTCALPTVSTPLSTANEDAYFFYISDDAGGDPIYRRGVYGMGSDGGNVRSVVNATWFGSRFVGDLKVTADGSRIAFTAVTTNVGSELWTAQGDGSGLIRLAQNATPLGFSADGGTLYALDGQLAIRAYAAGGSTSQALLATAGIENDEAVFSPDRRYLAFRESGPGFTGRIVLLDLSTGATSVLAEGTFSFLYTLSPQAWSADSRYLAVPRPADGHLLIYHADGGLVREISQPSILQNPSGDLPAVLSPVWSSTSAELGYQAVFGDDSCPDRSGGLLMRADLGGGDPEAVAATGPFARCNQSYHVSTWDGTGWAERGVLHFGGHYSEQTLDLSRYLPDAAGEWRVRIHQTGRDAAHVDAVSLLWGKNRRAPLSAVHVESGEDVRARLSSADRDAVDLHEATLEVRWAQPPGGPLRLALLAQEEDTAAPKAAKASVTRLAAPGPVLKTQAAALEDAETLPARGVLLWDPAGRILLYNSRDRGTASTAVFLDEENRQAPLFGSFYDAEVEGFSPTGRRLLFASADATGDSQSACYQRGFTDDWSFRSLLNLTADLRIRRSDGGAGYVLEGTATDLHFARYELEYASAAAPDAWSPVTPPVDHPVIDGQLATWIAPGPGDYLVRLTAVDLAGNRRISLQRVSSVDTPSLTDLYASPDYVSPNGDGAQDTWAVHYRVLAPVHLEFHILNDSGSLVRTLLRDHGQAGEEASLTWDGRDDHGAIVPDGTYKLTVLGYELFVVVDSTPPEVTLKASSIAACGAVNPGVGFTVRDGSLDLTNQALISTEMGEGTQPSRWDAADAILSPGTDPDELEGRFLFVSLRSLAADRFRVTVRDRAGNQTQAVTPAAPEVLNVTGFGRHELDPATGQPKPVTTVGCGTQVHLTIGLARLEMLETVRTDLTRLFVQFQAVPVINGQPSLGALSATGWSEDPVTDFVPPVAAGASLPDLGLQLLWGMSRVTPGVLTAVRVRAVDAAGSEHLSGIFTVLEPRDETVTFRGLLDPAALDGSLRQPVESLLTEAGLDPTIDRVLWGTETIREPLASVTLLVRSTDDPRFATPRALAPAALADGAFVFRVDARPCLHYFGRLVAVTEPFIDPATGGLATRTFQSNEVEALIPCLDVKVEKSPLAAGACGAPSPSTVRTFTLTPASLDGSDLKTLTLSGPGADGRETLLFNVNRPVSGRSYAFDFDTRQVPEGRYLLSARLTNAQDQERILRPDASDLDNPLSLTVDRTPPVVSFTYPQAGQRVCGVPRAGRSVVDLEGRIQDAGGFAYQILATGPGLPAEGIQVGGTLCGPGLSECVPGSDRPSATFHSTQTVGALATLLDSTGEYAARLEAVDNGGNKSCAQQTFVFDGKVEGVTGGIDHPLLSPNGDGVLDDATVSFRAAEPVQVDAVVYPAVASSSLFGPACAVDGAAARTLARQTPILEAGTAVWDGRDDAGQRVPDGLYSVVLSFQDACGNTAKVDSICVEVDTTPPALAIAYPRPTDPLPTIVEAVGSVADPHLQGWSLDFGAGSGPATWARIGSGDQEATSAVLGDWNTFGLSGGYTLRLFAADLAGNQGEVRVPVTLAARTDLISYLETQPRLFSPNGDGQLDAAGLRFGLVQPSRVDLTVLDDANAPVAHLLSDQALAAGAAVRTWDGGRDGGAAAADGTYHVQLLARLQSNPNVTQSESVTVELDRTAPQIVLTRPAGGFVAPHGAITGSVEDAHLTEYGIALTSTPQAPVWQEVARGTASRHDFAFASLEGLAEGAYALRVQARDAGGLQAEQVIPFTVDSTAPAVRLTAPAAGSVLGAIGGAAAVQGTVEESHLASWTLAAGRGADPASWTTIATGTTLPQPLAATWSLAGLADGPWTLRLTATDQAGQTAETRLAVTVDNTAPVAALTRPAEGGYVTGALTLLGTAGDANLAEYRLAVAAGAGGQYSDLGAGTATVDGGALLDWLALPPDGPQTLRLTVTDRAGNQSVATVRVTVDTRPPSAPQGLAAALERQGLDARLGWQASPEADVAGYLVERDGARITSQPVAGTSYLDANLAEGSHTYAVRAVDRAGLASPPSTAVEVRSDRTAPTAQIFRPAAGSRVGGVVDVLGTAFSQGDFKEFRLFAVAAGGGSQLLRRSPVPAQADLLAQWSTLGQPEDAAFTLRLEAEDVAGNVAVATAAVTVDNRPPAAPTGLAATAAGANASLAWTANAETDLAGYLLYRDGRLVNAAGPVVGSLASYLLTATSYADRNLPDGTFAYQVYAMDRAGNVSGPSAVARLTLDTHAPHAVISLPHDGAQLEGSVYLLATTPDTDVAQVQLQYRAAGATAWLNLGAPLSQAPWETQWNPSALAHGDYQIQAVATDLGNRTDPSPAPVTVTYSDLTAPAAPQGLGARVDGGDVALSWSPVADADLAGYHVERSTDGGGFERLTDAPVPATTYQDQGLADAGYLYRVVAVDGTGNESNPSNEAPAAVSTPALEQPYTPTAETATDLAGTTLPGLTVSATAGSSELPSQVAGGDGRFSYPGLPLPRGETAFTVRGTDGAGNRTKPATVYGVSDEPPAAPTGLSAAAADGSLSVQLAWNPNGEADLLGYRLLRDGDPLPAPPAIGDAAATASDGDQPEAATDGAPATAWSPAASDDLAGRWLQVTWPERRQIARVEIDWGSTVSSSGVPVVQNAGSYDVEAWDGRAWVAVARVRGDAGAASRISLARPYRSDRLRLLLLAGSLPPQVAELRVFHHPLVTATSAVDATRDGVHSYRVIAIDPYGLESAPSDPTDLTVGDVVPPAAPADLTATVAGSDVGLAWTASASGDVVRHDVFRDGAKVGETPDPAFTDAGRPNGTYRYSVRAVDGAGNPSPFSNEAQAVVAAPAPPAPVSLGVTAPSEGGALTLAWSAGNGPAPAGYRVLRGTVSGGPYSPLAVTAATGFTDRGVTNGQGYVYVVVALDALGNASAFSNEAGGTPADTAAPAAPILHYPGLAGRTLSIQADATPVAGTADPGAIVALARNGSPMGQVAARTQDATLTAPALSGRGLLSPDGRYLLSGLDGDDFSLYDFTSGALRGTPVLQHPVWLPDGSGVVFVREDGQEVDLYRPVDGTVSTLASGGGEPIAGAAPAPDQRTLVLLATHDGTYGLWRLETSTATWSLVAEDAHQRVSSSSLTVSPDGGAIAFRQSFPDAVAVARPGGGGVTTVETQPGPSPLRWSPAGDALLFTSVAQGAEAVRSYHPADGTVDVLAGGPEEHVEPVWSFDGRSILFAIPGDGVYRQPLSGGDPVKRLELSGSASIQLDVAPAGYELTVVDGTPARLEPAGRFAFSSVPLPVGVSSFTAVATDGGGNASPASAPLVIDRTSGDRPDLGVTAADLAVLPAAPLAGATVRITVTVRNLGAAAAPAADVSVAVVGPDGFSSTLVTGTALSPLPPGGSQTFTRDLGLGPAGRYTLVATVDASGQVAEADEDNNQASRDWTAAAAGGATVAVATDRSEVLPGGSLGISVDAVSYGDAFSGRLAVTVEDEGGELVAALLDEAVANLAYAATLHRDLSWSPGATFAGGYRVAARLYDPAGVLKAEATAPFGLAAFTQLTAEVETDRGSYAAGETVGITGTIRYQAGNGPLSGAVAKIQVFDAGASPLLEVTRPVGDLLPGGDGQVTADWPSGTAAAGSYRVRLAVEQGGTELIAAETLISLTDGAPSIEGTLAPSDRSPAWGSSLDVALRLANRKASPLAQLPVHVRVLDPVAGTTLSRADLAVDLPASGTATRTASFDTRTLGLGNRLVVLEADLPASPAGPARTALLDAAALSVVDRTPPEIAVVTPAAGSFAASGPTVVVSARDALSPLGSVEASVDGGAWQALALRDTSTGRYGKTLAGLAEGDHTLRARAADSWGNQAEAVPLAFAVDATPPVIAVTGVADGAAYPSAVTPAFTVADAHPGSQSATLNGRPFLAGTVVSQSGHYTLSVVATDAAGNRSTETVAFSVGAGAPRLLATQTGALAADGDGYGQPSPGDVLEYRVTIANDGDGAATGVVLSSQVPARTTVVPGSTTSSAGTVVGETPVQVAVGTLAAGAQAEVRYQVRIDAVVPAGVSEIVSQGAVTSDQLPAVLTDDPAAGGAADPTVTAILAMPRLAAELTDALAVDADVDGSASPGDTLEYQAVIRNAGNTSATNVDLALPVPAHTRLVPDSAATTAGTVTSFGESGVEVYVDELAGGRSVTLTFEVRVDDTLPAGVRSVTAQGAVTSAELPAVPTDDPRIGGAADPTVTPLTAAPSLTATETALLYADADGDGVASPGDTLLYRIEVVNGGNTSATGVRVSDPLPDGTALAAGSIQTSQGTVDSQSPVQVTLGEIPARSSAVVTFRVRIDSPFPASRTAVSNQASVTSAELPTVPTDDPSTPAASDPTVTQVAAAPVLSAAKTAALYLDMDGDGRPSPGDLLEYRVTIANTGNTAATGVSFADPAPAHATVVADSVATSVGTVDGESPVQVTVGALAAGGRVDVRFQVVLDDPVPAGVTAVSNQGTVASDGQPSLLTDDPAAAGAADPTVTPITASPRLAAELSDLLAVDADQSGAPSPGDTLEYRAVVRSSGNTPATGVALSVPIPEHTAPVAGSAATTAGTLTGFDASGGLRVALGEIAAGASATVTFRVRIDTPVPAGARQIVAQGAVTAAGLAAVPTDDPGVDGGADATVTSITAAPSLAATKTAALAVDADGDGAVSPGDTLLYSLRIANGGNTPATAVAVADPLPADTALEPGSVQTSQGSVASESPVQVSLGEIAAGAAATVTFRARVASPFPPSRSAVSNQATVSSAELPPLATDDPATPAAGDATSTPVTVTPQMTIDGASGTEGGGPLTFTVRLAVAANHPVTAGWSTANGTATAGVDYAAGSGTLSFAPGETVKTLQVALIDDAVNEPAETFVVQLGNVSGAVPAIPSATGTIRDDDAPPPAVRISIGDVSIAEGNQGTANALFPVTLSAPSTAEVRVAWATGDGTARAGQDYQAGSGVVVFAPGEASKAVAVAVLGDTLLEPDETFSVALASPAGATIDRGRGTGTIRDDERCASPNLLANPGAELPSPPVQGAVSFPGWINAFLLTPWQQRTADPSPAEGIAYFSPGIGLFAELFQDVPVAAWARQIDAGGQSFAFGGWVRTRNESPSDVARIVVEYRDAFDLFALGTFDSGEIASPLAWRRVEDVRPAPRGTRFIRVRLLANRFAGSGDDGYFDGLSLSSVRTPVLAVPDVTVYEGNAGSTGARFDVTLSCPFDQEVTVAYATANGTALAGHDYQAVSGTLRFPAGTATQTVVVPVLGDTVDEPHQTFYVDLSNAGPAGQVVVADPRGVGTIVNDDFCPRGAGYWKTHRLAWPATSLVLGGRRYGTTELLALLAYGGPDAASHLARQLVATKFNLLEGSPVPILPTVDEADAFLATFPPGSNPRGGDKTRANDIKDRLESYNENGSCEGD